MKVHVEMLSGTTLSLRMSKTATAADLIHTLKTHVAGTIISNYVAAKKYYMMLYRGFIEHYHTFYRLYSGPKGYRSEGTFNNLGDVRPTVNQTYTC